MHCEMPSQNLYSSMMNDTPHNSILIMNSDSGKCEELRLAASSSSVRGGTSRSVQ